VQVVQAVVLILLYRVFIGGINTESKLHLLYPSIPRPDFINTKFLWFDIAQRDLIAPAIVAGYIFTQIIIKQWRKKDELNNAVNDLSEELKKGYVPNLWHMLKQESVRLYCHF